MDQSKDQSKECNTRGNRHCYFWLKTTGSRIYGSSKVKPTFMFIQMTKTTFT